MSSQFATSLGVMLVRGLTGVEGGVPGVASVTIMDTEEEAGRKRTLSPVGTVRLRYEPGVPDTTGSLCHEMQRSLFATFFFVFSKQKKRI